VKGTILDFSIQNNSGVISAEDGERYNFTGADWKSDKAPAVKQVVDFSIEEKNAKEIYLVSSGSSVNTDGVNNVLEKAKQIQGMEFFIRAYQNYANFKGRDTRQQYWMFYLFYMIVTVILSIVDAIIGIDIFSTIFILGSLVPSIAIATRRLHDIGKSGWWQLIILIPLVGVIVLIVFLAKQGTYGENQYGEDPINGAVNA
jgi:uncharacterized membrane protein YhaH (DUF805 family)